MESVFDSPVTLSNTIREILATANSFHKPTDYTRHWSAYSRVARGFEGLSWAVDFGLAFSEFGYKILSSYPIIQHVLQTPPPTHNKLSN